MRGRAASVPTDPPAPCRTARLSVKETMPLGLTDSLEAAQATLLKGLRPHSAGQSQEYGTTEGRQKVSNRPPSNGCPAAQNVSVPPAMTKRHGRNRENQSREPCFESIMGSQEFAQTLCLTAAPPTARDSARSGNRDLLPRRYQSIDLRHTRRISTSPPLSGHAPSLPRLRGSRSPWDCPTYVSATRNFSTSVRSIVYPMLTVLLA